MKIDGETRIANNSSEATIINYGNFLNIIRGTIINDYSGGYAISKSGGTLKVSEEANVSRY